MKISSASSFALLFPVKAFNRVMCILHKTTKTKDHPEHLISNVGDFLPPRVLICNCISFWLYDTCFLE